MELAGEAQEVVAPFRGKAAADSRLPQSSPAECSCSSQCQLRSSL